MLRLETERPSGQAIDPTVEWIVESTVPPIGRRVQIEVGALGGGYGTYLPFEVRFRLPEAPASPPSPEVVLPSEDVRSLEHRNLFRVLEWFRDPWSPGLWQASLSGDWRPPDEFDADRMHVGIGLDVRWQRCVNAEEMLQSLRGNTPSRKLLLLAAALCRLLPLAMLDERTRQAAAAAERFAEESGPRREFKKACKTTRVSWLLERDPFLAAQLSLRALLQEAGPTAAADAADRIRDIVGNPFQPGALRRSWLRSNGAAVVHLAEVIAREPCFEQMPILADALEDAGCTDAVLLGHCRTAAVHVPGCWVLDQIRGKI